MVQGIDSERYLSKHLGVVLYHPKHGVVKDTHVQDVIFLRLSRPKNVWTDRDRNIVARHFILALVADNLDKEPDQEFERGLSLFIHVLYVYLNATLASTFSDVLESLEIVILAEGNERFL